VISRIHQKLGTAGFVISIVALVAALSGGAYAASGGLSGKQKKEVEKIAKKYAGKPGAAGAAGAAGPAGAKGDTGAAGTSGLNGAAGAGVTSKAVAAGAASKCEGRGGSEFSASGQTTFACNGKEGKSGFSPELPSGETSVGVWSANGASTAQGSTYAAISFPYPVEAGGYPVHFVTHEEIEMETGPAACTGSTEEPTAEAGNLCVYENNGFGLSFFTEWNPENGSLSAGAGTMGTILQFSVTEPFGFARGVWALTAE
jgi:hypothetical protein